MDHPGEDKRFDVFGFGFAAVDELIEVAAFPQPDSKAQVRKHSRHAGGLCMTALVAAARLGARAAYWGPLGENDPSDFIRQSLRREGVAFPDRITHPEALPVLSWILVNRSSSERIVLFSYEGVAELEPEEIQPELLAASRALLVDHYAPRATLRACRLARQLGVPSVGDFELIDDDNVVMEVMARTDHLILSLGFARKLTGLTQPEAAVEHLARTARACTAVTGGAQGCWFIDQARPGVVQRQPAFEVAVVDTTGCGDVFHGAYAAALARNMAVPEALRFAAAAAAIKATQPGGQTGIPDCAAVETFLAQR
ncbi:MAG: PfkB family carbohydrate kinase [Candidatus Sumerlaeota bacterium]|nr:PfkB family carbohydrate kinase [Candidatus Sumerlaeota bacterium]